MGRETRRDVAVVVGVCALTLLLGAAGKACRGFWHQPASFLCHSDIRALYPLRGVDRDLFPYVHGELRVRFDPRPPSRYHLRPVGGAYEYPVLTGVVMWLPSAVTSDDDTYLAASILLLAPFGLAAAWLLARMVGQRALLWSASPILLLYAFHNWDLPPVAASVLGFWCWWRGRRLAAAGAFGAGAAWKLFPLLFLVPLVLERLVERDRAGAARTAGVGLATVALLNLPVAMASPEGWAIAYRFQALRPPNYDSLWGVLRTAFELDHAAINALSSIATVAVLAVVGWLLVRRAGREGSFPFLPACAALLAGFLLVSKVHSPQYALWLLPLFALVAVRTPWYVAFVAGNVLLYAAIFGVSTWSLAARDVLVWWGVWVRTATFLGLCVAFLRAPTAVARPPRRDPR